MEDEQIVMFMQFTGCQDISTARKYLDFGGGDLENAISLFMESGPDVSRPQSSMDVEEDVQVISESVRAPIAPVRETLQGSSHHFFSTMTEPPMMRNRRQDDGDRVWEEDDKLAALFRPPFDLMFTGTFDMARSKANEKQKWLMVTIHDPKEFQCQVLNRDLWKSDEVKEIVRQNFIFLQFGRNSDEGEQHETFYPFNGLPYIAIIDPLTGERVKQWTKPIGVEEFIFEVLDFLNGPVKIKSEKPKESKTVTMLSEEEQLELAIAASLDGTNVETILDKKQKEVPKDPKSRFEAIEPSNEPEPAGPPTEVTRIQIRFPDGTRAVRKILKSAPVRDLYAFIKGQYPDLSQKHFDLMLFRESLMEKLDSSITDAGLEGCSLTLDFI